VCAWPALAAVVAVTAAVSRRGRWVRTASLRNGGGYGRMGGLRQACLIQCRLYSTAMTVSDQVDLGTLARVGTALADPTRRRVLVQLTGGPGYPAEMAEDFGTTRANLSNHLTCLRECGLVTATAEGRRVRYELADQRLADGLRILAALDLPGSCR
jgi:DNA-binding transcriptional ArsR family regulator